MNGLKDWSAGWSSCAILPNSSKRGIAPIATPQSCGAKPCLNGHHWYSGNIQYINPHFTKLTGYGLDEVIGKNPRIIQSGDTSLETYDQMWRTIRSGKVWRGEVWNKKKTGEPYCEVEIIAPVIDSDGAIVNYIAIKEDVTAEKNRKRNYEKLMSNWKSKWAKSRRCNPICANKPFETRLQNSITVTTWRKRLAASYPRHAWTISGFISIAGHRSLETSGQRHVRSRSRWLCI